MRTAKAILQRNVAVGSYAPIVISPTPGATARAVHELGLSRLTLAGVDATPEQLIALAEIPAPPEPSEEERAAEYERYTSGYFPSEDEGSIPA